MSSVRLFTGLEEEQELVLHSQRNDPLNMLGISLPYSQSDKVIETKTSSSYYNCILLLPCRAGIIT